VSDVDQIRQWFPEVAEAGLNDEEVIFWLADRTGRDPQELGALFGVVDPDRGNFGRGMAAAWDLIQGATQWFIGNLGDLFALDGVRDWGLRGYQRNIAEVNLQSKPTDSWKYAYSFIDSIEYLQYWAGIGFFFLFAALLPIALLFLWKSLAQERAEITGAIAPFRQSVLGQQARVHSGVCLALAFVMHIAMFIILRGAFVEEPLGYHVGGLAVYFLLLFLPSSIVGLAFRSVRAAKLTAFGVFLTIIIGAIAAKALVPN
jgi:hypothetical protein